MMKTTLYLLIGVAFFLQTINAQCLLCDSNDVGKCINPDGTFFSRACDGGAKCYVRVVEGRVIRGCQKDLLPTVMATCSKNEDETTCKLCDSSNCNGGLFPHHRIFCHHCDERQNEGNCTAAIQGTPTPCRTYEVNDKCIVRKHEDHVIRECLSDYVDCNKESNCKTCDTHGCNNEEYNAGVTVQHSLMFIGFAFLMTKLLQ